MLSSGVSRCTTLFIGIEVAAALTTIFLVLVIYNRRRFHHDGICTHIPALPCWTLWRSGQPEPGKNRDQPDHHGISIFLLLALIGYIQGGDAPILVMPEVPGWKPVFPLPQAMVLTAIVIGLATNAMILTNAIRLYKKYGTFDIREIRDLKG